MFLNDHIFKWEFSNWVTGKLSDFVGLVVFPFFLTFLFPKAMKWNVILTGLFFVFFKSPYSEGFIELYNSIAFIEITRVVDYSDLIALSVLPLSYYLMTQIHISEGFLFKKIKVNPLLVLLPSVFVFMATTKPYWHDFIYSKGNVVFYKNDVNTNKSQVEILSELKAMDICVRRDTTRNSRYYDKINFFVIDELVMEKDTIKDLRFSLVSFKENKTKVYLNAITISEDVEPGDVKKELTKYYRKLLRKYVKKNLK